jgi:hypothetical protein
VSLEARPGQFSPPSLITGRAITDLDVPRPHRRYAPFVGEERLNEWLSSAFAQAAISRRSASSRARRIAAHTSSRVFSPRYLSLPVRIVVVQHLSANATMAQDPATCIAAGMPSAVIARGAAQLVLPVERLASALTVMVMVPGAGGIVGRAA